MQNDAEHILRIAREIENYLSAHPRGTDTLTGVANWWITQQRFMESKERVEKALEYLVQQGKVLRKVTPDGTAIYSNPKNYDEKSTP